MKPKAILTADWHLRNTIPKCRIDDYLFAQKTKVEFIFNLAKKYGCPILISGDLGHQWKWAHWLERWFIKKIKNGSIPVAVIAGQHDLKNHRLDLINETAIGVLKAAKVIDFPKTWLYYDYIKIRIKSFHYGSQLDNNDEYNDDYIKVAMSHQMVIENKKLWPDQQASTAMSLLKKYPLYKLILTGDNHLPFTVKYKDRLLVNPGSIMRMTTDQINHKPRVYLWDGEEVEPVYLPIEKGVIDVSHIEEKQDRDQRIEAFASKINDSYDIDISFQENMKRYLDSNRERKKVKEKIYEAMEN